MKAIARVQETNKERVDDIVVRIRDRWANKCGKTKRKKKKEKGKRKKKEGKRKKKKERQKCAVPRAKKADPKVSSGDDGLSRACIADSRARPPPPALLLLLLQLDAAHQIAPAPANAAAVALAQRASALGPVALAQPQLAQHHAHQGAVVVGRPLVGQIVAQVVIVVAVGCHSARGEAAVWGRRGAAQALSLSWRGGCRPRAAGAAAAAAGGGGIVGGVISGGGGDVGGGVGGVGGGIGDWGKGSGAGAFLGSLLDGRGSRGRGGKARRIRTGVPERRARGVARSGTDPPLAHACVLRPRRGDNGGGCGCAGGGRGGRHGGCRRRPVTRQHLLEPPAGCQHRCRG